MRLRAGRIVFQHTSLIDVRTRVHACRDPDDNKYLACAVDAELTALCRATAIVSLEKLPRHSHCKLALFRGDRHVGLLSSLFPRRSESRLTS